MRYTIYKYKLTIAALELGIFLLITLTYVFIIQKEFAYMGFVQNLSIAKYLVGILFFLPFVALGLFIKDDFSYAVWHCIFILFYFGQIIFFQFTNGSIIEPVIANALLLIIFFITSFFTIRPKLIYFGGQTDRVIFIVCLALFIPIFIKYLPHVKFDTLFFKDVYDTRMYFREFDDSYFGYFRAPLARIMLPTLMIIALLSRNYWRAALSVAMIVFIFMVGALKSVFVGMLAGIFFMAGSRYHHKVYLLIGIFAFLSCFGIVFYLLFDNTFFVDALVRRILFIPAYLDTEYYTLFKDRPLLWSHNEIGNLFFSYPLDRPLNLYVGEVVLEKEGMSANVGLITEGYSSFGFVGVFLHSIFIAFFFLALKSFQIKPVFFGLIFVYIYYINTSFITVLLLTHGALFFIFFAYVFLNKKAQDNEK